MALGSASNDHLPLIRRIVGYSWIAGGLTAVSVLLQAEANPTDHRGLAILAAVEIGAGTLALLLRRTPAWFVYALLMGGIVAVSAAVAISRPVGPAPFFYLLPIITVAYFMSRLALGGALLLMAVTLMAALLLNPDEPNQHTLFVGTVLTIATTGFIVMQLKERLQAVVAELRVTAATDPLTGLLNRRAWGAAFEQELERARAAGRPLTLVLFDIDHFKLINDRHGHAGGDAALERFARLLEAQCFERDLVARIGGEEFAVVLYDTDVAGARAFAGRVAKRLGAEPFTVSAGIASADRAGTAEELMLAADRALYGAKARGRDRVEVWDGALMLMGTPSVSRAPRAAAS